MNYIRHITTFYSIVKNDDKLTPSHMSLYMALFQYWNFNRFQNPFPIYRDNLMQLSKIGSKNTYHKCIRDLHLAKYIYYHQSLSKFQPVKISIIRLDKKEASTAYKQLDIFNPSETTSPGTITPTEQSLLPLWGDLEGGFPYPKNDTDRVPFLTATCPIFNTVPVPKMGHNIKHKHLNIVNEREENSLTQKIFSKNKLIQQSINKIAAVPNSVRDGVNAERSRSIEGSSRNTERTCPANSGSRSMDSGHIERTCPAISGSRSIPSQNEIQNFFTQNNYPTTEAQKFFNHYQSNGWLVGGKSPMKDWHSSAHKWMLNVPNFKPNEISPTKPIPPPLEGVRGRPNPNKNYDEPL